MALRAANSFSVKSYVSQKKTACLRYFLNTLQDDTFSYIQGLDNRIDDDGNTVMTNNTNDSGTTIISKDYQKNRNQPKKIIKKPPSGYKPVKSDGKYTQNKKTQQWHPYDNTNNTNNNNNKNNKNILTPLQRAFNTVPKIITKDFEGKNKIILIDKTDFQKLRDNKPEEIQNKKELLQFRKQIEAFRKFTKTRQYINADKKKAHKWWKSFGFPEMRNLDQLQKYQIAKYLPNEPSFFDRVGEGIQDWML